MTGTGFAATPSTGSGLTGMIGSYCASTRDAGNGATGTLTLPSFTVTKHYLNFLICGGNTADTCGEPDRERPDVVLTASGVDSDHVPVGDVGHLRLQRPDGAGARSSTTKRAVGASSPPTRLSRAIPIIPWAALAVILSPPTPSSPTGATGTSISRCPMPTATRPISPWCAAFRSPGATWTGMNPKFIVGSCGDATTT